MTVKERASRRRESVPVIAQESGQDWTYYNGDCVEVMRVLPDKSIHLSLFSPPFSALYTYSASERDLGNTRNMREFLRHFRFVVKQIRRVMIPGRNVCVHIQDIRATVNTNGYRGLQDFTNPVIRTFEREGFVYRSRITIDKNPQSQAARNKVHELMFVTKGRDASWSAPVLPDYLLVFGVPGENPIPIPDPIDNETWIEWARALWPAIDKYDEKIWVTQMAGQGITWGQWLEWSNPCWYGIRETDVLNVSVAKSEQDERHLCPLQLPVIDRSIRLWTNPGEVVLSPFGGIASEGVGALRAGRRFVGIELKDSYFRVGVKNLQEAEREANALTLFSEIPE